MDLYLSKLPKGFIYSIEAADALVQNSVSQHHTADISVDDSVAWGLVQQHPWS